MTDVPNGGDCDHSFKMVGVEPGTKMECSRCGARAGVDWSMADDQ